MRKVKKRTVEVAVRPPLRVAAYCRVSTSSDEQYGSLEMQKRAYSEMIDNTDGWENAGVFGDVGTGRNLKKRPEFRRMMTLCRRKRINLIVTKSVSRFGRNTLDTLQSLQELRLLNVDVWFEIENVRLLSQSRRLPLEILAAFAQAESESRSENIRWGLLRAFENPDSKTSHFVCYGYEHDGDGRLVVKENEAEAVRQIFQCRADGMSLRKISAELETRSIPSPTGNPKWSAETLNKLLRNEKYIGQVRLQKTFVADFFSGRQVRNRGEREQWLVTGHHEPIVDESVWTRVSGKGDVDG